MALICTTIFLTPDMWAQQDTGSIVGNVRDSSGALLPNAEVKITNEETNLGSTFHSDEKGFYISTDLPVGPYSVEVKAAGFAAILERHVIVNVASRVEVDVALKVGNQEMVVTIDSTIPPMDTTNATLGAVIDSRAVENLPLNGGNVLALAALLPGVVSAVGADSEGFNNRGTDLTAIKVGGGATGANGNILDGVNNLQTQIGEVAINPGVDSIREFRIQSGVVSAQYGFTSGGIINLITKTGSQSFHGSIYEYFRNDAMDAQNAFANQVTGKPELRYNQYGASLGGPLFKDRIFFFANYEEYRYVGTTPAFTSVPTPQERTGDFSDLLDTNGNLIPLYDPTTTTTVGTVTTRQTYTAEYNEPTPNVIPASKIDPVALKIQNLFYPLPNNTPTNAYTHTNNYASTSRTLSSQRRGVARFDGKLSEALNGFLRFGYYENKTNNAGILPSPIVSDRNDDLRNMDLAIGVTQILSANKINETRVAVERTDFPFEAASYGQNWPGQLGLANVPADTMPQISNGLPAFNVTYGYRASTQTQLMDDFTWIPGSHTLHLGVDLRLNQADNNQNNAPSGTFSFTSNLTGNPKSQAGTGSAYASFLTGYTNSASDVAVRGTAFRTASASGYIQDDWRAMSRLTVNVGLRYDYQEQPFEQNNGVSSFDLNGTDPVSGFLGKTIYANTGGYGRNFFQENYKDFGPRIGFAYTLASDGRTVIRGGYAIYYSSNVNQSYFGSNNGFGSVTTSYTALNSNSAALLLKNGFPAPPPQPQGAAAGPSAFLGQAAFYQDPHAPSSMSQQYTLSFERELPSHVVVDVAYLANHGTHFVIPSININQLPSQYLAMGDALLTSVKNPYAGKVPGTLGAATITLANSLKPYPYYTTVTNYQPHYASYFGNYGYLSVQRRAQHGLQVLGSYTYGKLLAPPIYVPINQAATGTSTLTGAYQNSYDLHADYGVDPTDVTHNGTLSLIYELPFGQGRRWYSHGRGASLIGGWQFSSIVIAQTGRPLSISGANNQNIATRPNFRPGYSTRLAHRSKSEWFNTAAYVNPPNWTYGTIPRVDSRTRGPGAWSLNLSVFKTFSLPKSFAMQFRASAFNALNHVNLGLPNTTFTAGPVGSDGFSTNINGAFGVISSAASPRTMQLQLKIYR
ncbi:TonB-dependent receptor [Granulicella rosea]|nr:carboxypeptidase regulatory-like domain-containing protein [Granulicella rosea]